MTTNKPWQKKFSFCESPYFGTCSSMESALQLVKEYEIATTSRFVVFKQSHDFGKASKYLFSSWINFHVDMKKLLSEVYESKLNLNTIIAMKREI